MPSATGSLHCEGAGIHKPYLAGAALHVTDRSCLIAEMLTNLSPELTDRAGFSCRDAVSRHTYSLSYHP